MVAVLVLCMIALLAALSLAWLIRDVRALHRRGLQLTAAAPSVNGVSPAGTVYFGNQLSH